MMHSYPGEHSSGIAWFVWVLILVLMDDALVLVKKQPMGRRKIVLILVLMDDALVQK